MNTPSEIQLLQVFNSGKACGWLGQHKHGYWFHYASNNPQQYWVSLLMPPSQNFYQQAELFPVFAQYGNTLTELHQRNGAQLGALSFANPDNPVVKQPLRTPPPLMPGQSALIAKHGSQLRRNFADTVIHPESTWPLVQQLQAIKQQADPNNRLQALRWALQAQLVNGYVQHPRPDMDVYQQTLYGFESVASVLNVDQTQLKSLTKNTAKFVQVMYEVVCTYCKNSSNEMELLRNMTSHIQLGHLDAYLVYEYSAAQLNSQQPKVLGLEYLNRPGFGGGPVI